MALRTVRIDGDPILRKISKEVVKFDKKLQILVEDMIEVMRYEDGVGLAAVQIGILKRIFILDAYEDEEPKIFINPEIIEQNGEQFEIEGCLSVPDITGAVRRPNFVKVKAQDINGNDIEFSSDGLLARAMSHEIDHLNGILFIDKVEEKEVE